MRNRVLGISFEGGKVDGIGGKWRHPSEEDCEERKRSVESRVRVLLAEDRAAMGVGLQQFAIREKALEFEMKKYFYGCICMLVE